MEEKRTPAFRLEPFVCECNKSFPSILSFTQHQEDKCPPSTPTVEQLFGYMSLLPRAFIRMTLKHPGAVYCVPCEAAFASQRQLDLHNKDTHAPFKKGKNKVSKKELMKPFARGGNDMDLLNQEILSCIGKKFLERVEPDKQAENKQDVKEPDQSKNAPTEKKRRNNRKGRKSLESTKSGVEQGGKAPEAQGVNCTVCDKSSRLESAMAQHRRIKHVSTVTVSGQAKVVAEVPTQPGVASTSPDKEKGDAVKTEVTATQGNAREAADKKPLRCETCNRPFGSKSALRQHKDVKHPAQKHSPQNNGRRTAKPNYHCNMCEKGSREKFGNQYALEKHQHKKHNVPMPVRPWPCKSCDRTFDTDSQLETHERCQHQIFRPKWHKFGDECVECDPMFPVCLDFPIAEEDDIVVQGFFDLNCQHDDCDKSYEDSEERRQHEITVHNRCLTCTGYFSSEAELKEHQSKSKMVSEERRTHLLQLEMVIRQKEVLAARLISSDVPKEEKTEDATEDKVAETQQDAGEPAKDDPLHCRACNKTFGSTRGFDEHQRTKHKKKTSQRNERPVNRDHGMSCDICGQKRFLTPDALDQHQRQKHEKNIPTNRPKREDKRGLQKPAYKIPCIGGKFICGQRFKKVSHMMLHIETNNCISFFRSKKKIADLFRDHMGPDAHKFYNVEKECFECPECKGSEFKNLTTLIIHAERDSCSMDPLKGPLHDAIREIPIKRMEKYLNPDLEDSDDSDDSNDSNGWKDSDDSDDSNDSDAWYSDEDPWENFFEGHHFQYEWDIDELESYGYYGL